MSLTNVPYPPPRISKISDPDKPDQFSQVWTGWFRKLSQSLNSNIQAGFSGTVTTAKLTPGGANGSMTFTNGVLTSQTQAT